MVMEKNTMKIKLKKAVGKKCFYGTLNNGTLGMINI